MWTTNYYFKRPNYCKPNYGYSKPNAQTTKTISPKMNVQETEAAYTVHLAVPGFTKEHIEIKVDQNKLIVKSTKPETKNEHLVYREFSTDTFEKRILLPKDADVQKISAGFEQGILSITIQKIAQEIKNINIQ
ncbi:MAG: Hsp20/alpha crystallin family protein [Bacteroidota bacterium]|nr:Hsp20/alpha crystallin family protein [Bacteroidota bacterium]